MSSPISPPVSPRLETPAPVVPVPPTVAEKVSADWAKYDVAAKGHLTKAELSRWLGDLRAANGEAAADDAWFAAAFAQTDSNKDKKITREELTASLSSGR